jgi:hypothetical protein
MTLNNVIKTAYKFEAKYNLKLASYGLGSIRPGSAYRGSSGAIEKSKFEKITDFASVTIPEFELFLKNIIPALKQMEKEYQKAIKLSDKGQNDLEGIAINNGIDWKQGMPIPEELESVMLSSIMRVDPVKNYFTKIASASSLNFIATKIALANRQLSFFERLKDKARSFFGGKKSDEEIPQTEPGPMLSPGLDMDLQRNKAFDLESKLQEMMSYVDSYIALYKSFYSRPTLVKLNELVTLAPKFRKIFEKVKTEVSQLKNLVSPSEKDIELQFFNDERTLEKEDSLSKSNITSICSHLMKDPDLTDPNNVKRAISLYKILENKLKSINAL